VTATKVGKEFGDLTVKDEQTTDDKLTNMCPTGGTPLGVHIDALAQNLMKGRQPTDEGKSVVISDGYSNIGESPDKVAKRLHKTYPNLKVDIIDVVGNPDLQSVSDTTGGKYVQAIDGESVLDTLLNLSGNCKTYTPPPPAVDKKGCGSTGNWWK
jgi:hypothetical protein